MGKTNMKRQHVRLVCEPTSANSEWPRATFDVTLRDGKVENGIHFGWSGNLNDEMYPFILRPDGRIDFGSDYPDSDRYVSLNLLEKKIEMGALFTAGAATDCETYRVSQMPEL